MSSDKLLVLVLGIGLVGFIYVWFLSDWGKVSRGGLQEREEHGDH